MSSKYRLFKNNRVKTGNQPHGTVPPGGSYLAKRYAKEHGYFGLEGGWIYDKDGQHVAHGYGQFYLKFAHSIKVWAASLGGVSLIYQEDGKQVERAPDELAEAIYRKGRPQKEVRGE